MLGFARSVGATGLHAGIIGALPQGMLFMQLLSALAIGPGASRKRRWFWVSLAQRVSLLPLAFGPWLLPQVPDAWWLWMLIVLAAANQGLAHFGTPLWLSWMGDYLPHPGLNRFWGKRQCGNQWAAAVAVLAAALLFFKSGLAVRPAFAILIVASSIVGVIDILCFRRVEEPPVSHLPRARLWDVLAAPFRQRDFRRFIWFNCFWHVAAMVGAPFISLYLLEHVGMDLFQVLLLWTCSWAGGSLLARRLGRLAESHGEGSVLVLCLAFKPVLMLALVAVPRDPHIAFLCLAPAFALDQVLNAGIEIANNGFMLKRSPRENRTMFIAAGTAFAGMAGGLTAIVAGAALSATSSWRLGWHGVTLTNFHALFALSVLLRIAAAFLATRLREKVPPAATLLIERAEPQRRWRSGGQPPRTRAAA
jgi:hypothetical protein